MITKARPLLKRLHKNEWSKAQDEFLESLHKPLDWNAVAERANSLFPDFLKTPEEYSKRWESLVKGAETKEPWSIREEVRMLIAHSKYKNKWSEMGAVLKGRTNNTIKNLSLIHISEPTRQAEISYAVFCLKKKKKKKKKQTRGG
eukprot:TRINITY_DN8392_c0_g1_i3.p1 TRINITY_DN8392_c0_g1~~TRINITY_DN8392_c0_g1_i3.p1  ORF type:complete len:145 (-),score=49.79 TRINITY_DN8392_c0_g1_i3:31-465(-)